MNAGQSVNLSDIKIRTQATVLLSGGVDSMACLALLLSQGFDVHCVFFDYGQMAAEQEYAAAKGIASTQGCSFQKVILTAQSRFGAGELIGRNAFFVFAALFVQAQTSGVIALGIHSGTRYFDCSHAFLDLANRLVLAQSDGRLTLIAPFITWSKKDIYAYCQDSGLEVILTYSCERGSVPGCGECLSCRDRQGLGC